MNSSLMKAFITGARAFADSLEADLTKVPASAPREPVTAAVGGPAGGARPVLFDPLTDEPPIHPNPFGTKEEKDMAYLTYVSAIYAINRREGRGATPKEVRKYAIKAGYPDARTVSGFSNRHATTKSVEGKRWVVEGGVKWVKALARDLDVRLPDDLA